MAQIAVRVRFVIVAMLGAAIGVFSIVGVLSMVPSATATPSGSLPRHEFVHEVQQLCGDTRFLWVADSIDTISSKDYSPYGNDLIHTLPLTKNPQGNGTFVYFNHEPEVHYAPNVNNIYSFGDGVRDFPFTLVSLFHPTSFADTTDLMSVYSSHSPANGGTPKAEHEWFLYSSNADDRIQHRPIIALNSQGATSNTIGTILAEPVSLHTTYLFGVTYDGSATEAGIRQYLDGKIAQQYSRSYSYPYTPYPVGPVYNDPADKYIAMQPMGEPLRIGSNIDSRGNPSDHRVGWGGFDLICGRELSAHDMHLLYGLVQNFYGLP